MFGHHNDKDDKKDDNQVAQAAVADGPTAPQNEVVHPGDSDEPAPTAEAAAPAAPAEPTSAPTVDASAGPQDTDTFDAGATDAAQAADPNWQHPGTPLDNNATPPTAAPEPISDVIYPAGLPKPPTIQPGGAKPGPLADESQATDVRADDDTVAPTEDVLDSDSSVHDLLDIKVEALDELVPLIDDLEMAADEKFRIIMMMIQASDNQELVPKAYTAAHNIQDEKTRAQALLDIVNEINYFTQPHQAEAA